MELSPELSSIRLRLKTWLSDLWVQFQHFPWRNTSAVLRERFREDRLGLTASSLTFTTLIALVPFFTVALAVFSAFPMFGQMEVLLQKWLVESLIPDSIARQVLGYLNQFSGKASRLGVIGLGILLSTALALILTIDRTLNNIWRVKQPRHLAQRVMIYWAAITLGPLLLGASLTATSYAISTTRGLVNALPGGVRFFLALIEFSLLAAGMAALYRYVPNTRVKWAHAWVGGLFMSLAMEVAKKLLAWYLSTVPTYSVIYGTFATVPILLLWIDVCWVIVLLGAVITAYLPSLLTGVARRGDTPGWNLELALEVLFMLSKAKEEGKRGLSTEALSLQLRVSDLQLEPVLEALTGLDWIGELAEPQVTTAPRHVLMAQLDQTPMTPLLNSLLLHRSTNVEALWRVSHWGDLCVSEALPKSVAR